MLGVVDFGHDVRGAVDAPRIHDQGRRRVLAIEPGIPRDTRDGLAKVGHTLVEMPALGAVAAVGIAADGTPVAAGDRRKEGGDVVVR